MISTPQPPDPYETAQAQSEWNTQTAATQQAMNMVNQRNPWGNLDYNQTGTSTIIGPDGRSTQVPQYTATTTLSPEQQAIFGQTQEAQGNLAGLAAEQSAFMSKYLGRPFDIDGSFEFDGGQPFEFDNQDAENWAYDLGSQRIDPRFAREEETLRSKLLNSGIREGSAAWNAEMGRLGQDKNDAFNQLMLEGRSQAFNEAFSGRQQSFNEALSGRQQNIQEQLSERNQPINELSALLSGSQVSMPQFATTPQAGVAGVDYTGLVQDKYKSELQASQAGMGGLFGLLSAGLGLFSDERLKNDIVRVGRLDNGLNVYRYRFGDGPVQIGVMAQEVESVKPEAVHVDPSGFLKVDYAIATEAS